MPDSSPAPDVPASARATAPDLLVTLQRLLEIEALDLNDALGRAAQAVVDALGADKADAMLHDPEADVLVALGTSDTPMGRRQRALGYHRLPLEDGGRAADVFRTGVPHRGRRSDQDPGERGDMTAALEIRSQIVAPLEVGGERRGVLLVSSATPDFFDDGDLEFLVAVGRWVGSVAHRAELVARVADEAARQARRLTAEEVVTVLAHDLGNLLAPLHGRLDLIRHQADREGRSRDARSAAQALAALERLRALVNDLLDIGRLERGLFAIEPEPVDLAALARATANEFDTAEVAIRVHAPVPVVVRADPARVHQALDNLVANAVKHSPPGGTVVVTVAVDADADPCRGAVTVADEGPGVAPELLTDLFSRAVRGASSTGLGLGLYLASRIAAAHGGTLTLDSAPGEGARFRLCLPSKPSPPVDPAVTAVASRVVPTT